MFDIANLVYGVSNPSKILYIFYNHTKFLMTRTYTKNLYHDSRIYYEQTLNSHIWTLSIASIFFL